MTDLREWEARLNVTAVRVLPWNTKTPVAGHIEAEGIDP